MSLFDTEQEAKLELENMITDQCNKFCPIINAQCRRDCVSFYAGKVYQHTHGKYIPSVVGCNNLLIACEITVE